MTPACAGTTMFPERFFQGSLDDPRVRGDDRPTAPCHTAPAG